MSTATLPAVNVSNRRKHRRGKVAAVAVVARDGTPAGVWLVRDLSAGGASMVGDSALISGERVHMSLYLAGRPPMELKARVLRRQVASRKGQCAVVFEGVTPEQMTMLLESVDAANDPALVLAAPDVFLVAASAQPLAPLTRQLFTQGRSPRLLASPFEAAAWLHKGAVAVLVEQHLIEVDGWNFMGFVRDTWPQVKRLVIASDVHSFRLNLALRVGLVEAVLEKPFRAAAVAEKLDFDGVKSRRPS